MQFLQGKTIQLDNQQLLEARRRSFQTILK